MPELTLLHVHGGAIGYGRLGVELAKSLGDLGVDVYDHLAAPDTSESYNHQILETGRRAKETNVVCWVSVPTHARGWWSTQHSAIFTMWEATNLPESFRETLHEFDTVIVPSRQNVELFERYHPNVHRVPLGVDPKVWHFLPRRNPEVFFDFLIAGSGPRKGTDLAYRAFLKLWGRDRSWPSDGPIPRLVMKNPRREQFGCHDRVEVIGGRLSADEEVRLYANSHCYLQPSRGEGWGLQPLQAIAQGLPTILTDAHGHAEFSGLGYPLDYTMSKASYFIYGDAGDWWEPDFDQLCDRMRWVYDNYEQALGESVLAADVCARRFTWRQSAEAFIGVFGDQLDRPFAGGEWHSPTPKRFLVVTNRDWTADIAGVTYQFRRGHRYWELADVKRILFEAGLLDPVCLTTFALGADESFDVGLTDQQASKIDAYTAAHSHCQLCGQPLNSQATRADKLFVDLSAAGSERTGG